MRRVLLCVALVAAVVVTACGGGGGGGGSVPSGTPMPSTSRPASAACLQTPSPSAPSGLSDQASSFFTSILPDAHNVCLSVWEFSSDVYTALTSAVHNGANVTVIVPYDEQGEGENATDTSNLAAAGAQIVWEYTGSAPASPWPTNETYSPSSMDIHAKFALVDGIAYMDGHNWFTTDVVMEDGNATDYDDMQEDLTTFPSSPPSNGTFTTDKQLSLQNEAMYITSENPQAGQEYDFVSEDFNPNGSPPNYNGEVYAAMCAAAANGATVKVVVEDFDEDSSTAKGALTNLLVLDPDASVRSSSGGLEKISMVRGASTAWFGSSNDSTTDLIDWGMTLGDAGVISALDTYYDDTYNAASPIPSPSPGAVASPCP